MLFGGLEFVLLGLLFGAAVQQPLLWLLSQLLLLWNVFLSIGTILTTRF
jgi:hypothetical protein